MNKKILLSAIALPAVFAACTQDDLSDLTNNNAQKRVVLEEVTFEDNAESRLAFDGTTFNVFSLKTGDAVGAYLIDSPNGILSDEQLATLRATAPNNYAIESGLKDGYTINSYINGSHKFVYDEAKGWETLDEMVEGNYIYVLPYQSKNTREPITTAIPQIQYLKYKEGTKELDDRSLMTQLIESGQPLAVGYEFLSRYDSKVAGALKQIYAYPCITYKNDFAESVTIQKIVINNKKKFALEGTIDIKKAETELRRYDSDPKANDLKNSTVAGNWTKAVQGNYYKAENYTADIVTPVDASKVDFIVVVAPENLTVASEASISFQAVIPAAAYADGDITVDIYTNKGVFQQQMDAVKFNNGLRYSSTNYSEGTLKANAAADKYGNGAFTRGEDMTIKDQTEIVKLDQVVVIDTNDLLAVINGEVEKTETEPNMIKVAPLSSVVINKEVVDALGTKKGLIITQDVDVKGTEDGMTLKNIDFLTNTATVTEGSVSFKNVTLKSLAIEKGATVVVDNNFTNDADIENKGTLNISAYNQYSIAQAKTLGEVINWGTMNITTPLKATTIRNGADNVAAYDDVMTSAIINALAKIDAAVENYGALNVKNSIAITTLNNNKVTKTDCADKAGVVTVDANKLLKVGGSNAGTIDVNGEFRAVSAFNNTGIINNNYGIENEAGVQLNNNGTIKVAADAKYTSVNDNAGIIEILDRQEEIHSDNNIGTILYVAEAGKTFVVMPTDKYNAVKFNEGTSLMVQMEGDPLKANEAALAIANKLKVYANAEGNYSFAPAIAGLEISNNVYATIVSDLTVTESVKIGTGATLHLGTDTEMSYNKSEGFVNGGTFRNMGILTAMCNKPVTGTWTGSGLYSWGVANSVATKVIQDAINNAKVGDVVTITEDVILSELLEVNKNITIDLNGKTIERKGEGAVAAIYSDNANVTLTGNGKVISASQAVWAAGSANITIEGGTYYGNIYLQGSGNITINGGFFESWLSTSFAKPQYDVLNKNGSATGNIVVNGGEFYCFNPANNFADGPNTNYLAPGKTVKVKSTGAVANGYFQVGDYDEGWYVVE